MSRTRLLLAAFILAAPNVVAQEGDPGLEIGAAYARSVTEKEKDYLGAFDELTKNIAKMKDLSQESKEDTINAMKVVVKNLIAEGKTVVSAHEKYKADSKAYLAAIDRMPSALKSMADSAMEKARKYENNPMGTQYQRLADTYRELTVQLPIRRKDVEQADAAIAQAVKETSAAIEFLTDYHSFLDVLSLGDITAAREEFRKKLHHFMANYQRFDSLMQQFHERLRSTSTSDDIRKDYEQEKRKKIQEQQDQQRQRMQSMEEERQRRAAAVEAERLRQESEARSRAYFAEQERKNKEAEYRRQYNANRAAISKMHADARRGLVVGYLPPIPSALPRGALYVSSTPQWVPAGGSPLMTYGGR